MSLGTRPIIHVEQSQGYVWDVDTLDWVPAVQASGTGGGGGDASAAKQDIGNASLASVDTKVSQRAQTPVSGSASSSGNNLLITPGSGKKLRISYLAYNPSASVEAAFRFGVAGNLFLRNSLTVGGSVIAKDYGDFRYIESAVNESLYLNLSGAVPTLWNVNYTEV